jgi:hypothetical protein
MVAGSTKTIEYTPLDIPLDVLANLPKDHALAYLRTLYAPPNNKMVTNCRFERDGVRRWWKEDLPGKKSYGSIQGSLRRLLFVKGTPVTIVLSAKGSREEWCEIMAFAIAHGQGGDPRRLTAKIATALGSMGVTEMPASELSKGLVCRQEWCEPARPK